MPKAINVRDGESRQIAVFDGATHREVLAEVGDRRLSRRHEHALGVPCERRLACGQTRRPRRSEDDDRPRWQDVEEARVVAQEALEVASALVRHEIEEVDAGWIAHDRDRQLVQEVSRCHGAVRPGARKRALREIGRRDAEAREQLDLVRFGRNPIDLAVPEHIVEHHDFPCDQGGTGDPPIAVVLLPERAIDRPRVHVVDVPTIRPEGEALHEVPFDERLQEIDHVLAVSHAGEAEVLTPQAVAAMERHRDEEAGLPFGEAERLKRAHTVLERHHNRSR